MFQMDLQRAERGLRDRRIGEAETICQSVLADRPDHVWALRLMAEIRIKQKQPELAWEFISRALDLDLSDPLLFNIRGRLYNNRSQLDEAEQDFRRALELDPQFSDAHNNLGHVLRRKGYKEAAEQCFRTALSHQPDHGHANLNLGAMLYEQGHIELAIRHLERGLDEEMINRPGRYNLAIAQHQVGRLDEAVHNYRQVIAEGGGDADTYSNLSSVLMSMGELETAAAGFETALEDRTGSRAVADGSRRSARIERRIQTRPRLAAPLYQGRHRESVHARGLRTDAAPSGSRQRSLAPSCTAQRR